MLTSNNQIVFIVIVVVNVFSHLFYEIELFCEKEKKSLHHLYTIFFAFDSHFRHVYLSAAHSARSMRI